MKKFGLMTLVLMGAVSAQASQVRCVGQSVKSADPQSMQKAFVAATLIDSERLDRLAYGIQDAGTPKSPVGKIASVRSDAQYKPRNPSYQGFNRFRLESSGWTTTYLLLPSNSSQLRHFRAYIQQTGHDSYPLIVLNCAQY